MAVFALFPSPLTDIDGFMATSNHPRHCRNCCCQSWLPHLSCTVPPRANMAARERMTHATTLKIV